MRVYQLIKFLLTKALLTHYVACDAYVLPLEDMHETIHADEPLNLTVTLYQAVY